MPSHDRYGAALVPKLQLDGVSMSRTLLVTGATGFVGAPLTLELLIANPGDRALCLVRAADRASAQRRLVAALRQAAEAYDVAPGLAEDAIARASALCGDLTRPLLGLDDAARERIRAAPRVQVFHAAASLKDSEPALAEILEHNVIGTERVLETLIPLGIARFNHVSTAYVCGRATRDIPESVERPRGFNNRYEQSKHYGECLVVDHCERAGVPWRVLRPAIVIGHSRTGRATGYTGFLGFVLKLAALDALSFGSLARHQLRFVAEASARLNIIPIDSVVEDIVGIDGAGAATEGQVFHLTAQDPPAVRWLIDVICDALGIARVAIVDDEAGLDSLSAKFHRWTRFERPYVAVSRQFRRDGDIHYKSPRHGHATLTAASMARMVTCAVADWRQQQLARSA